MVLALGICVFMSGDLSTAHTLTNLIYTWLNLPTT